MLFIILMVLWIVFSGGVSLKICLTGAAVSFLIVLFCTKFMGYRPLSFGRFFRRFGRGFVYVLVLLKEIVLANLSVLKYVYGRKEPEARLVHFKSDLDSEGLQVLVANSITLTPGTITVDVKKTGEYTVHGLDASMTDGIDKSVFFRQAEKMKSCASR